MIQGIYSDSLESFLATSAPNARRLKITEELLLKILTYHQVSPYFLNLISSFGHEPLSGAGDHFFGGFRSRKFFSEPLFNFSALGRSGCHYQLAFEFRTVFRPPSQDAEHEDRQLGEREIINGFVNDDPRKIRRRTTSNNRGTAWRLLPSWLRPRGDDDADDEAATEFSAHISDNPDLWPLGQCAIYHHFDVGNGKSLWMMTAAEGEGNRRLSEPEDGQGYPFRDVKDARFSTNVLSSSPIDERFRASLSVLLWLADWSLSEYGHYITMLDDELQRMVFPPPSFAPESRFSVRKPTPLTTARHVATDPAVHRGHGRRRAGEGDRTQEAEPLYGRAGQDHRGAAGQPARMQGRPQVLPRRVAPGPQAQSTEPPVDD